MTPQQHPKITIKQDGKVYDLYNLPKGFVIKGDLNLGCKWLKELPDLSDVIVKGNFNCSSNRLTSLSGAPKEVRGGFSCYGNHLINLSGAPQKVGGYFICSYNWLTSLYGGPKEVGGDFNCSYNMLTSLLGAPEKCCFNKEWMGERIFSFVHNKVTSLQYLPMIPKDWHEAKWFCSDNPLVIDDNVPDYVLENIHSLCGISKELKDQLVLKRRAQKLRLAR